MFEKLAYAADAVPAQEANPLLPNLVFILLLFGIFYFFIIRPQQKRQQDLQKMIANLKKGDRVATVGGVIGMVHSLQDDYVVLRVGDNEMTKIEVLKSAISGLRK